MAANYWASTQAQRWVFTRDQLAHARAEDIRYASATDLAALGIWLASTVIALAKRVNLRQRVSATAIVFLKRFYAKNSYCSTDPVLVIATCVYVASKVEESPVPLRTLQPEAVKVLLTSEHGHEARYKHSLTSGEIAKMEFYLLEELEFDLVVHHPYRTLVSICEHMGAFKEKTGSQLPDRDRKRRLAGDPADSRTVTTASWNPYSHPGTGGGDASGTSVSPSGSPVPSGSTQEGPDYSALYSGDLHMDLEDDTVMYAWLIINDIYRFDTCLLYPPYMIALAALMLSLLCNDTSCQSMLDSTNGMRSLRQRWNDVRDKNQDDTIAAAWAEARAVRSDDPPDPNARAGTSAAATAAAAVRSRDRTTTTLHAASRQPDAQTGAPRPPGDALTVLAGMNVAWSAVEEIIAEILANYELWNRAAAQEGSDVQRDGTTWWNSGVDPELVGASISPELWGDDAPALKFLAKARAARWADLENEAASSGTATAKGRRR